MVRTVQFYVIGVTMESLLQSSGCCSLCRLRFKRSHAVSEYKFALMGEKDAAISCPCCLGVLQRLPDYVDQIVADIDATGFEIKDFNISVMLPAPVFIRQYGFWHLLVKSEKCLTIYPLPPFSLM